jgi:predicted nucleic acid-binding protein
VRGWLLDTNVVSDLRKPKPDSKVINFIAARPGETCFLPTSLWRKFVMTRGAVLHGLRVARPDIPAGFLFSP